MSTSTEGAKVWPQPVVRALTTYGKTVYVQAAEWADKKRDLLREMQANGWPRRFNIKRNRIERVIGEPRSQHPERGT